MLPRQIRFAVPSARTQTLDLTGEGSAIPSRSWTGAHCSPTEPLNQASDRAPLDEDIRLYCVVQERHWHYHPTAPGPFACVSPVTERTPSGRLSRGRRITQVRVPPQTSVLLASGASTIEQTWRLSAEEALTRQLTHARHWGYLAQVDLLASYDYPVVQKRMLGRLSKAKERWQPAQEAAQATIRAAEALDGQRRAIAQAVGHRVDLVFTAQGVDLEQYLVCCQALQQFIEEGYVLGLGGWSSALGHAPRQYLPLWQELLQHLIPWLARHGVRRLHLWGIRQPDALGSALWWCQQHQLQLSTSSAWPALAPVWGTWGTSTWRVPGYDRPPILSSCRAADPLGRPVPCCDPDLSPCRGLEQARHVQATRAWLADFGCREPERLRPGPAPDAQSRPQEPTQLPLWRTDSL